MLKQLLSEVRGSGRTRQILGKSFLALVIRIGTVPLTYGALVGLARWMDGDEYGRLAFGLSLANTAALFLSVGQPRLVLRFVGEYHKTDRPALMRALIAHSTRVSLLGAVGAALLVVLYSLVATWGSLAGYVATGVLAGCLALALSQSQALNGFGLIARALAPRDLFWHPTVLAAVVLLLGPKPTATLVLALFAAVLGTIVLLQNVFVLRPVLRAEDRIRRRGADPTTEGDSDALATTNGDGNALATERERWRIATPGLWAVSALGPSLQHVSVVVLGAVLSASETGAFFAAVKTASMLTFPLQAVNLVVSPQIARHFANGDLRKVQRLANFSASVSGLTALAGCLIIGLFGGTILGVFDPEYSNAQLALLILGGGYLISAVCGTSNNLMTMTGHERVHVRILIASNVTAILLTVVLSLALGVLGAALGLALGLAVRNLWLSFWARWYMGVDPSLLGLVWPPRPPQPQPNR